MTPEQAEKYRATKRAWKEKNKEKMQEYRKKYNDKQKELAQTPEAIAEKEQRKLAREQIKAEIEADKERVLNELFEQINFNKEQSNQLLEQRKLAREQKATAMQALLQAKRKAKEKKEQLLAEKQENKELFFTPGEHRLSRKDKQRCARLVYEMEQELIKTGESNRNIAQCYDMCELIELHFKRVRKLKEQKEFKPDKNILRRLFMVSYTRQLAQELEQFYDLMQELTNIDFANLEQIIALYDIIKSINTYFKEKYKK